MLSPGADICNRMYWRGCILYADTTIPTTSLFSHPTEWRERESNPAELSWTGEDWRRETHFPRFIDLVGGSWQLLAHRAYVLQHENHFASNRMCIVVWLGCCPHERERTSNAHTTTVVPMDICTPIMKNDVMNIWGFPSLCRAYIHITNISTHFVA